MIALVKCLSNELSWLRNKQLLELSIDRPITTGYTTYIICTNKWNPEWEYLRGQLHWKAFFTYVIYIVIYMS